MTPLLLVHGYNANGGDGSTDRLIPYLRHKYRVIAPEYRWFNGPLSGLLGARFLNNRRAGNIARSVHQFPKLCAIGHSNGAAILLRLVNNEPKRFKSVILVNPALNVDSNIEPGVRVFVYHTPLEMPTRLARWLPFHEWGQMGAKGYQGTNSEVFNINTSNQAEYPSYYSTGHSDKFSPEKVGFWAGKMDYHLNM